MFRTLEIEALAAVAPIRLAADDPAAAVEPAEATLAGFRDSGHRLGAKPALTASSPRAGPTGRPDAAKAHSTAARERVPANVEATSTDAW